MPKVYIPDAATLRAAQIDRETNAFLAAHDTEAEKLKAKETLQADAFTHTVAGDVYAGNSIDVESVAEESLAGEIDGERLSKQEASLAKKQRKKERKMQARSDAMELSDHTRERFEFELRVLDYQIARPTSEKQVQLDAARVEYIRRRFREAKIFETHIVPLLKCSKSTAERTVKAGQKLWANLIRLCLNRNVDPAEALPYLASLPRDVQLAVAHEAEYHREMWLCLEEIEKAKRPIKLDNASLRLLPREQLLDAEVREELARLPDKVKARRIAKMRVEAAAAYDERERRWQTMDRIRDQTYAGLSTNLRSLMVQTVAAASKKDQAEFLETMGLIHAPVNTNTQGLAS
jgi:hypothetical protein